MHEPLLTTSAKGRPRGSPAWLGWALAAAFIGVASWLGTRAPALDVPLAQGAGFDHSVLTPRSLRVAMVGTPQTVLEGKTRRCGECHLAGVTAPLPAPPSPHGVTLNHGMNDWCFNCHDIGDRERLVLQDTTTVAYAEVPVLCAQCHGTTYRDWQQGMHGKTTGSWDKAGGSQRRLLCTECHNPHSPAYGRLAPLPGPNTLRMGADGEEDGSVDQSPLHFRGHDGDHKGGHTP